MKLLIVSEGASELDGALATLVQRLRTDRLVISHDRASRADIHVHFGKGRGYFKRAVRWLLEARKRGFDALVMVIDEDGDAPRVRQISEAQVHPLGVTRRALGVAIRTFDAWMLADEKALTGALGNQVQRQSAPEGNTKPKSAIMALFGNASNQETLPEVYRRISDLCDLQILIDRCPKGFGKFATRVELM
ncbi:MAG: hypothetical protein ACT4QC_02570 [Planctomycetaceae bacterium]